MNFTFKVLQLRKLDRDEIAVIMTHDGETHTFYGLTLSGALSKMSRFVCEKVRQELGKI